MTNEVVQQTNQPLLDGLDCQDSHNGGACGKLHTLDDIARLRSDLEVMTRISGWIDRYLVRPHAQLGRTGPVCPFARGAQMRDSIRISVARAGASPDSEEMIAIVRRQKQEFFLIRDSMKAEERIYASVMIAFPDVSRSKWPTLIDGTKQALKPEFVRCGLMLGEFHADSEQPGLHNSEFRPLRCPVPMLVMRQMVPSDIAFLGRPEDSPAARMEFLTSYLASQSNLTQPERTRAEELLQAACLESANGQTKRAGEANG